MPRAPSREARWFLPVRYGTVRYGTVVSVCESTYHTTVYILYSLTQGKSAFLWIIPSNDSSSGSRSSSTTMHSNSKHGMRCSMQNECCRR